MKVYFDVVVSATCPNGYEDIRSYNEIEFARLSAILHDLKSGDRAVVTYLFGREIEDSEH